LAEPGVDIAGREVRIVDGAVGFGGGDAAGVNEACDGLLEQITLRSTGSAGKVRDLLLEFVRKLDHLGNHDFMVPLAFTIPFADRG
jgi:hypothetical protein